MNSILRISKYLFRYKGMFGLTLMLALASTVFALAIPIVIGKAVDQLVERVDTRPLWGALALMALFYALRDGLNCLRIRVNNKLEQTVLIDIRRDLHGKLLQLPISFYDRRKSGEIASRVVEDVNEVERALLDGSEQGVTALCMLLGVVIILFSSQPILAGLVILPLPIVVLLGISHAKATRKNWKQVRESSAEMNSVLVEDIQGNRLIQSFALQQRESTRFSEVARELRKRTLKAMWRWSLYSPGTSFISSFGLIAVVGYGGHLLHTDPTFTYGGFVTFFAYAGMLFEPVNRLNGINHLLAAGKAAGDRVFEILDHPVSVTSRPDPKPFPTGSQEVKFSRVNFAYPDRPEVLRDFDLTLINGQVTALVGHTGAGKSTVANLLLRYYDVLSGSVSIGGVDVRDLDLAELRGAIGTVAQEPFLFDGSVLSNMRLANDGASEDRIREALKDAHALDFVDRLPDGIHTLIGERGVRLSQGEKQRLTIARILLRDPKIIILDEATSSVDTETEQLIQAALDRLMTGRTVLVIAHRLSTIRRAHNIVCLDHGCIIEQGTHEALLVRNGQYAKLWRIQADFFPDRGIPE